MKPLRDVPEDDGPFRIPLACLNHLFPFHLARHPLRRPPPAGDGLAWTASEAAVVGLAAALLRGDAESARAGLAALGPDFDASDLFGRWWIGAPAFLAARAAALGLEDAVPPAARRRLLADAFAARMRFEAIEPAVRETLQRLERADVPALVLKGVAHARLWYPEPWTRPVGDLDLLVPPDRLAAATDALVRAGFERRAHDGGPDHHHAPPLATDVGGHPLVVELHARVAADADGAFTRRAWADRAEVDGLPALGRADRVAHLALHHTGELEFRNLLDLGAAALHEPVDAFADARRRLPARAAWRLDLAAGLADAFLGGGAGPPRSGAVPAARRRAIERGAGPDWARAHAVWMCRCGGRERPRHWLEPWRPRVHEVVRSPRAFGRAGSAARAALAWGWRQVRLLVRVVGDVLRFCFPSPAAAGVTRRASLAYAGNALRAVKSVASRLVEGLRGGRVQSP